MFFSSLRPSASTFATGRRSWWFLISGLVLATSILVTAVELQAQTISGVVEDPAGAVIPDARIEITGGDLTQPIVLSSDGLGKFVSPQLKPGSYVLRISREGFESLVRNLDLRETPIELELKLAIAPAKVIVPVPAKAMQYANSDALSSAS
jgi:Carboxypeptidase regulatory-like domain